MAVTLRGRLATSQFGAMEANSSREIEARNYLEKHRIMELLTYLTSALLFFRPAMFQMLDSSNKGSISFIQYKEALKTLGLCTADEVLKDDGHGITCEKFMYEVNKKTQEIWSAF
ncbi:pseudouridylate synthase 7 homolog isoform X4 [Phocoena sinus]|uniref:pseudouridylate synthase 7 homolog isoform X4 n=1 Tax=Phocoena sinus TaxID=42100 RepID=UPI0013C4C309|nr:pseudouridylate synthase 7 homolog isoform X4 [Phocoena sinus]